MTDNDDIDVADGPAEQLIYLVREAEIGYEWALTGGLTPPSLVAESWVKSQFEDLDTPLKPDEPDITPRWVLENDEVGDCWHLVGLDSEWEPASRLDEVVRGLDEDDRFALVADTDHDWRPDRSWLLVPEDREIADSLVGATARCLAFHRVEDDSPLWTEERVMQGIQEKAWDRLHVLVARDLTADQAVGIIHALFD